MPDQRIVDTLYGPERGTFWGMDQAKQISTLSAISPRFRDAGPDVQRAFLDSEAQRFVVSTEESCLIGSGITATTSESLSVRSARRHSHIAAASS